MSDQRQPLVAFADAWEKLVARVEQLERQIAAIEGKPAQPAQSDDDWLTVAQVAELRGITVAAMHKLVQRERVPIIRIGRAVRIRRRDALGGNQ